jgi:acetolactate synthase-1/2/3 large subunit
MWAAQHYRFDKPRHWLSSGGLGTMGVGLPYAIGAAFANQENPIVCITGDGSIQMCSQELATARQYSLPLKIILLNNQFLGMVRQWQELFYDGRYSQTTMNFQPDFVRLAEAYGHIGLRVERIDEIEPAFRKAFVEHKNDLVLIDVRTSPRANVLPMVAAGKGLSELILAQDLV